MLGLMFGFKTTAIAVAIALSVGAIGGWRTHAKFADAAQLKAITAAYRAKVAKLEDAAKQINTAARNDQDRAATAETKRAQAEDRANAAEQRIKDGVCYSDADTLELRQLWPGAAARKPH